MVYKKKSSIDTTIDPSTNASATSRRKRKRAYHALLGGLQLAKPRIRVFLATRSEAHARVFLFRVAIEAVQQVFQMTALEMRHKVSVQDAMLVLLLRQHLQKTREREYAVHEGSGYTKSTNLGWRKKSKKKFSLHSSQRMKFALTSSKCSSMRRKRHGMAACCLGGGFGRPAHTHTHARTPTHANSRQRDTTTKHRSVYTP